MTVNEVIAREEVRALVDEIMSFGISDIRSRLKVLSKYYTYDAHMITYIDDNVVADVVGRDKIADTLADALEGVKHHYIMNGHHQIELDVNYEHAVDKHMSMLTFQTKENGVNYISTNYVFNIEKLKKEHGQWLVCERESHTMMIKKVAEAFNEEKRRFDVQFTI